MRGGEVWRLASAWRLAFRMYMCGEFDHIAVCAATKEICHSHQSPGRGVSLKRPPTNNKSRRNRVVGATRVGRPNSFLARLGLVPIVLGKEVFAAAALLRPAQYFPRQGFQLVPDKGIGADRSFQYPYLRAPGNCVSSFWSAEVWRFAQLNPAVVDHFRLVSRYKARLHQTIAPVINGEPARTCGSPSGSLHGRPSRARPLLYALRRNGIRPDIPPGLESSRAASDRRAAGPRCRSSAGCAA